MLSTLRPDFVKQTVKNFMSHYQVSEKYLAIHWRYSRKRFITPKQKNVTWIFHPKIPGNYTNFDVIRNDFESSTN